MGAGLAGWGPPRSILPENPDGRYPAITEYLRVRFGPSQSISSGSWSGQFMTHHLTQVAHIELPVTDFAGIEVVRFKRRIATMPMPMAGPGRAGSGRCSARSASPTNSPGSLSGGRTGCDRRSDRCLDRHTRTPSSVVGLSSAFHSTAWRSNESYSSFTGIQLKDAVDP